MVKLSAAASLVALVLVATAAQAKAQQRYRQQQHQQQQQQQPQRERGLRRLRLVQQQQALNDGGGGGGLGGGLGGREGGDGYVRANNRPNRRRPQRHRLRAYQSDAGGYGDLDTYNDDYSGNGNGQYNNYQQNYQNGVSNYDAYSAKPTMYGLQNDLDINLTPEHNLQKVQNRQPPQYEQYRPPRQYDTYEADLLTPYQPEQRPEAESFRSPQNSQHQPQSQQPLPLEPAYTPPLEAERPVQMPRLERPAHFGELLEEGAHFGAGGGGGGRARRQHYQQQSHHEGYGHGHGQGHGFDHDGPLSPLTGDKDPLSAVPRLLSGSGPDMTKQALVTPAPEQAQRWTDSRFIHNQHGTFTKQVLTEFVPLANWPSYRQQFTSLVDNNVDAAEPLKDLGSASYQADLFRRRNDDGENDNRNHRGPVDIAASFFGKK